MLIFWNLVKVQDGKPREGIRRIMPVLCKKNFCMEKIKWESI